MIPNKPHEWATSPAQPTTAKLISLSCVVPRLTARDFVRQHRGQPRFYWHGRDGLAFAGAGAAAELFAWEDNRFQAIATQARQLFAHAILDDEGPPLARPRLFGGFAFRHDFVPDNAWASFHPAHFVLPHYQLLESQGEAWLTINAQIPADEAPETLLPDLRQALKEKYQQLAREHSREGCATAEGENATLRYPMPYEQWREMIDCATERIRAGAFQKVVLSRVGEVRFGPRAAVDVDAALDYLDQMYPECYRFLFEPRPHNAFYGATPELLAHVDQARITTMGLAGSMPRGDTAAEDAQLGQALLDSAKNQGEHRLVVEALAARLAPVTHSLSVPTQPQLYTLSNIHHLYTPIEGILHQPQGILPLLEILHPTPALGGTPRDAAMQFIREMEPVPRGWYAAPVGWVDHRLDGLFGVAIRSAVAQNNRVWAYAGAGIVADSLPATEWDETAVKFRPMLDALGIVNRELSVGNGEWGAHGER